MDFENTSRLSEFGFAGGISIAALQVSCANVPTVRGVYLVVRNNKQPASFLETSIGGHFRGRDPSVPALVLKARWLASPKVVYIGKAGGTTSRTTIHDRVHMFMRFGLGHSCAHWGGRYIWQLADAKELLVYWRPTPVQEPWVAEQELLSEFVQKYGQLPFANLRM